jgi:hypothetical protein
VGPDAALVVRFYQKPQPYDAPETDAMNWWLRWRTPIREMLPYHPIFEGYNEEGYSYAEALRYSRFELQRMTLLHNEGARAALLNCGVVQFAFDIWRLYSAPLAQMLPGDAVAVHEYWPDRPRMFQTDDLGRFLWAGRFRSVPELKGKPLIVTECGRDFVNNQGARGWQLTCGPDEYVADLADYNAILCGYPDVIGATIFQTASSDSQWRSFEITNVWEQIKQIQGPDAPQEERMKVPDLAYQMLRCDTSRVVVTMTPEEHVLRGEHIAVDLAGFHNAPIVAPWDGWVEFAFNDASPRGRGWTCGLVRDKPLPDGRLLEVSPCHMSELAVAPNQKVRKGEILGYSGWSGYVEPPGPEGEHVHLVVYVNSADMKDYEWIDPTRTSADYALDGEA